MFSITIEDLRSHNVLVSAISSLMVLNDLHIDMICPRQEGNRLGIDLLHRIQPSIQRFRFAIYEYNIPWDQELFADDFDDFATLKKNEPLSNLVDLYLWEVDKQIPTSDFLSIFSRCPSVETLTIPGMDGHRDLDMIATVIGK